MAGRPRHPREKSPQSKSRCWAKWIKTTYLVLHKKAEEAATLDASPEEAEEAATRVFHSVPILPLGAARARAARSAIAVLLLDFNISPDFPPSQSDTHLDHITFLTKSTLQHMPRLRVGIQQKMRCSSRRTEQKRRGRQQNIPDAFLRIRRRQKLLSKPP